MANRADAADLLLHRAEYLDPTTPRTSPVRVSGPDRTSWDLRDPELADALERISGMDLDLLQLGIGAYDSMPLSIVTTASLQELEERHGARVDNRSLRANIIIDGAISERTMDGRRLIVGNAGGAQLLPTYLAPRCSMVTIDPSTAERDPRVMRTIVQHFEGTFAMYASVACPGMLRVGDEVRVVEA